MDPITAAVLGFGFLGAGGKAAGWWGGKDKKEESKPTTPSYEDLYRRTSSPKISEYQNLLEGYGKERLAPSYQAISPAQQSIIYNRIKSTLQPQFDEGLEGQLQNIQTMGIEGTPGAAILSKLRKDYVNDLSGRATDIAIQDITSTLSEKSKGADILNNLRSSLMGEASGIVNQDYSGAMDDYTYNREREDTSSDALWGTLGQLGGNLLSSYLSPQTAFMKNYLDIMKKGGTGTSKGMYDILGSSDMFGGTKKNKYLNYSDIYGGA